MSKVAHSSLSQTASTNNAGIVFDVSTEVGVLQLLRRIHTSTLTLEQKNEIRDILFSYKNADTIDIQKLTTLVEEAGIRVVNGNDKKLPDDNSKSNVVASTEFSAGKGALGISRPIPTFTIESEVQTVTQKEVPTPTSSQTQTSVAPAETPVVGSESTTQTTPPPVQHTETAKQDTEASVTVAAEQKNTSIVEGVNADANTQQAQTQDEPSTPTSLLPLERIKEIKKEVNALVGNPVNLIDVHNEIGREYMNALLDAMKKNNGGAPTELQEAMVRLEKAYAQVKQVITSTKDQTSPTTSGEQLTENETHTSIESDNQDTQANTESDQRKEESNPNDASTPVTQIAPEEPVSGFTSVHQTHVAPAEQTVQNTSSQNTPEAPLSPLSSISSTPNVSEAPSIPKTSKEEVEASDTMMSVAKQKQIKDLMLAKKQEAATTEQQRKAAEIASMDPLMTPEVTDGLKQLLSEWSLFKSSGLFGTGPSGIEHPLYKQLSKLNMTAIVAGRFEGASPQIKRSITDYMNGWRYEEGILQEQGELFEHYLRRVIKHILDKRK